MKPIQKIVRLAASAGLFIALASASVPLLSVNVTEVDASQYPMVRLKFSAWNSNGVPIEDLTAQEIFLSEEAGVMIHPESVSSESGAPLSVLLALDVSGSMQDKPLQDAKNAANRFLEKLGNNDQVAVLAFADQVNIDPQQLDPEREIGFSRDKTSAFNLIESLRAAGGTEIFNIMQKAVEMTSRLPQGHRVILLLTDGKNDPPNVGNPQTALDMAIQEKIPIFTIGLGEDIDQEYLQTLTGETGGYFRLAPGSSELSNLFSGMASLFKTGYTLTYTSNLPADSTTRRLKLRIDSAQGGGETETTFQINMEKVEEVSPEKIQPTSQAASLATPTQVNTPLVITGVTLGVIVLILAVIRAGGMARTKKDMAGDKCGHCGHVLSKPGVCPICGSEQRILAKK